MIAIKISRKAHMKVIYAYRKRPEGFSGKHILLCEERSPLPCSPRIINSLKL